MEQKIILITQARVGSSRLPFKVLKEINGAPLLKIHIDRILKSKLINEFIVATTILEEDNLIIDIAKKCNVNFYRGSENDVLDRYYQSIKNRDADWIVRVTSDCPLIDSKLLDSIITEVVNKNYDYGSNTLTNSYPDGQDVEIIKFSALKKAWENATLKSDREHVTTYIKNNSTFFKKSFFTALSIESPIDFSNIRMTVDENEDFEAITILVKKLGLDANWLEYANFISNNNNFFTNQNIKRNEGYLISLKNDNV